MSRNPHALIARRTPQQIIADKRALHRSQSDMIELRYAWLDKRIAEGQP